MITIKKSAKYPFCFINGKLSYRVVAVLDQALSYYYPNYQYMDSYKKGNTDGKCHLLRRTYSGTYYFAVGLLDKVKSIMDSLDVEYEVIDPPKAYTELDLKWKGNEELREYQRDALLKALTEGRGVVSMPTGAGKTLLGIALIYSLDCSTLVTCHTRELFYQWKDRIEKTLGYKPGLVGDGHEDWKDITIGILQSLTRKDEFPEFDMLLSDEVHHLPSETFFEVAMKCNAPFRYGMSATAAREQGDDLKIFAGTGDLIVDIPPERLIDEGYLAEPKFVILNPPAVRVPRHNWQKAYSTGIVNNEKRNDLIARSARELVDKGLKVYIHVSRINHGELLSNAIGCPFISGKSKSKERDKVIEDFKNDRINCMVSTLLGEGVDLPMMDAIIMAHGQKTQTGTIQKMGRVLRPKKDRNKALIVDFQDKGLFLSKHFESRMKAYETYYGKFFKPLFRNFGVK